MATGRNQRPSDAEGEFSAISLHKRLNRTPQGMGSKHDKRISQNEDLADEFETARIAPCKRTVTSMMRQSSSASPQQIAGFVIQALRGTVEVGQDAAASPAAIAETGVSGSGSSLPYLNQIQNAFGPYEVGSIRAHVGGQAADAASALSAEAFAFGSDVAFQSQPDLHTAAHEAAHVVQQRSGVSLKGGIGVEGDQYERHADAVADAVVRGQSAEPLLSDFSGGTGTGLQRKALQLLVSARDSEAVAQFEQLLGDATPEEMTALRQVLSQALTYQREMPLATLRFSHRDETYELSIPPADVERLQQQCPEQAESEEDGPRIREAPTDDSLTPEQRHEVIRQIDRRLTTCADMFDDAIADKIAELESIESARESLATLVFEVTFCFVAPGLTTAIAGLATSAVANGLAEGVVQAATALSGQSGPLVKALGKVGKRAASTAAQSRHGSAEEQFLRSLPDVFRVQGIVAISDRLNGESAENLLVYWQNYETITQQGHGVYTAALTELLTRFREQVESIGETGFVQQPSQLSYEGDAVENRLAWVSGIGSEEYLAVVRSPQRQTETVRERVHPQLVSWVSLQLTRSAMARDARVPLEVSVAELHQDGQDSWAVPPADTARTDTWQQAFTGD